MSRLRIDIERERAERRRERDERSRGVVSGVGVIAFIHQRGWGRIRTQTGEIFFGDDSGVEVWRLHVGTKVTFRVGRDSRGRRQARHVWPVEELRA